MRAPFVTCYARPTQPFGPTGQIKFPQRYDGPEYFLKTLKYNNYTIIATNPYKISFDMTKRFKMKYFINLF